MTSFFQGSAALAVTLLSVSFLIPVNPSAAETPAPPQQQKQVLAQPTVAADVKETSAADVKPVEPTVTVETPKSAAPVMTTNYTATAYSLYGKTASGRRVSKGLIAADPSLLPLGTRVRLEAGNYSGEYLVADTGGSVRGKRIDIWTPSGREAMRFGRRMVRLTVLTYGPRLGVTRRSHRR